MSVIIINRISVVDLIKILRAIPFSNVWGCGGGGPESPH